MLYGYLRATAYAKAQIQLMYLIWNDDDDDNNNSLIIIKNIIIFIIYIKINTIVKRNVCVWTEIFF